MMQTANDARKADVDRIDVAYVAHLARLHLTTEETSVFQGQLEQIVQYVRKMDEADVEGVEPTSHALRITNVFRQDEIRAGLQHETVIANAPAEIDEQFMVPKIVE